MLREVRGAALPRARQDTLDRVLEPFVVVRDRQAHALKATRSQGAQELDPERLRLDLADIEADHLTDAGVAHGVGDHQRLGAHVPGGADLHVLGVQPQVRVGAFQRALPEDPHLLVQSPAERRDTVLGHPSDSQLLDQLVDLHARPSSPSRRHRQPSSFVPRPSWCSLLDRLLVEPTSLDTAVARTISGLPAARYTTSTDTTTVRGERAEHRGIPDDSLTAAVRRIVRDELVAFFEPRVAELRSKPQAGSAAPPPETEPTPTALKGVSPYDNGSVRGILLEEEDGGPLHVRVIAERMRRLGFKHRRQPKNPEQILSSLNSLASPSQHPDRFKRNGPRILELVR